MELANLSDDLLVEFCAERQMIYEQVEMLVPLGVAMRLPAAQNLVNRTLLLLLEIACYLISAGGVVLIFKLSTLYPFDLLNNIYANAKLVKTIGNDNLNYFVAAIYGLAIIAAIAFFIIGRLLSEIRQKNNILRLAAKDIKMMVGQQLERQAAIQTIEEKHMLDRSGVTFQANGSSKRRDKVNDIENPGFGD